MRMESGAVAVNPENVVDIGQPDTPEQNSAESLSHIVAVLKEHQTQLHRSVYQFIEEQRIQGDVAPDFVLQEDEENEDDVVVVDRKEDPDAVITNDEDEDEDEDNDGDDGNNANSNAVGNIDSNVRASTDTISLPTEMAPAITPFITPTPSVTPFRTPIPVVLRTPSLQPPSRQQYVDMVNADTSFGYKNHASGHEAQSDTTNDAAGDSLEQAWESIMLAARDGVPVDHPFVQPFE